MPHFCVPVYIPVLSTQGLVFGDGRATQLPFYFFGALFSIFFAIHICWEYLCGVTIGRTRNRLLFSAVCFRRASPLSQNSIWPRCTLTTIHGQGVIHPLTLHHAVVEKHWCLCNCFCSFFFPFCSTCHIFVSSPSLKYPGLGFRRWGEQLFFLFIFFFNFMLFTFAGNVYAG